MNNRYYIRSHYRDTYIKQDYILMVDENFVTKGSWEPKSGFLLEAMAPASVFANSLT